MPSHATHASGDATSPFEGLRTADVDGTALAYREQGEGEPVVFVHGSASDVRWWDQQLPTIGMSYRAIAYSRRYARPNPEIEPGADDPMLPHVDDLEALVRGLDAAPAHLVGHSWGAFICLLDRDPPARAGAQPRARRAAGAVALHEHAATSHGARKALCAPAEDRTRHPRLHDEDGLPRQKAFRRGDDEQAIRSFAEGFVGKEGYERLPEERKNQLRENVSTLRAQLLGAGFPPLSDDEVRRVAAPTLLMTGERSPALPLRLTDRLQELLPNPERVEIAGASHAMTRENPAAANAAILDFLSRARQRR